MFHKKGAVESRPASNILSMLDTKHFQEKNLSYGEIVLNNQILKTGQDLAKLLKHGVVY